MLTASEALMERFLARGFQPGLEPQRSVLVAMHELTQVLLDAFDGEPSPVTRSRGGPGSDPPAP